MVSYVTNIFKTKLQQNIGSIIKRDVCVKSEKLSNVIESNKEPLQSQETVFGQPTFTTHPHLIREGELLPCIKIEEFQKRRKKFMELIFTDILATYGKPMHTFVIIPSATKVYMTEKIPYVFHQNTDFLYLSGCLEPDTAIVFNGSCNDDLVSTLLLREQDSHSQLWDGPRTGLDVAQQMFGVEQVSLLQHLPQLLKNYTEKHRNHLLYYDAQNSDNLSYHWIILNHIQHNNITVYKSCKYFIDQLRVIKSSAEQNLMRRAGEISSIAIERAMKVTKPGMTEHQLFATVDYESRMLGAKILAYPPVVASGKNAKIIHYIDNNQVMKDGDLVLMDAGCEYHGYCGDITRTWPINGKFTKYQQILYEIVLDVQKQIILYCKEKISLDFMYQKMINLLGQYLRNEKILKHNIYDINELNAITMELCPHHVSHYLGLDIHDVKTVPKNIALQSGMVVTIEPGLYIREQEFLAPEFWNTGIRIEDNILITDSGYEILSEKCPKEVQKIQTIMSQ